MVNSCIFINLLLFWEDEKKISVIILLLLFGILFIFLSGFHIINFGNMNKNTLSISFMIFIILFWRSSHLFWEKQRKFFCLFMKLRWRSSSNSVPKERVSILWNYVSFLRLFTMFINSGQKRFFFFKYALNAYQYNENSSRRQVMYHLLEFFAEKQDKFKTNFW